MTWRKARKRSVQIRLNEVYDVVDHIVIVESAVTHQERAKPLHYKENASRYARFADKIIPIALKGLLKTKPNWFTKLQSSFHMCALGITWATTLLWISLHSPACSAFRQQSGMQQHVYA